MNRLFAFKDNNNKTEMVLTYYFSIKCDERIRFSKTVDLN